MLSLLDPTQHSAAMLCDLQCRSSQRSSNGTSPWTPSWWSTLFLHLMTLTLQTTSKAFLLALWTHSPLRMARLMQASMHRLTSPSTTSSTTQPLLLSRSMAALAQRNAATRRAVVRQGAMTPALRQRLALDRSRRKQNMKVGVEEQHRTQPRRQETGDLKALDECTGDGRIVHGHDDGVGR